MKKMAVAASIALAALILLPGCDAKERESLKNQVSALEQQVSQANASMTTLQTHVQQIQTDLQSMRADRDELLARVDKLGSEVDAVKKAAVKPKAPAKATSAVKKKPAVKSGTSAR